MWLNETQNAATRKVCHKAVPATALTTAVLLIAVPTPRQCGDVPVAVGYAALPVRRGPFESTLRVYLICIACCALMVLILIVLIVFFFLLYGDEWSFCLFSITAVAMY